MANKRVITQEELDKYLTEPDFCPNCGRLVETVSSGNDNYNVSCTYCYFKFSFTVHVPKEEKDGEA